VSTFAFSYSPFVVQLDIVAVIVTVFTTTAVTSTVVCPTVRTTAPPTGFGIGLEFAAVCKAGTRATSHLFFEIDAIGESWRFDTSLTVSIVVPATFPP
jgi:hypothetical protein